MRTFRVVSILVSVDERKSIDGTRKNDGCILLQKKRKCVKQNEDALKLNFEGKRSKQMSMKLLFLIFSFQHCT